MVLQPFGMPSIGKRLLPSIGMPKSLYMILCDIHIVHLRLTHLPIASCNSVLCYAPLWREPDIVGLSASLCLCGDLHRCLYTLILPLYLPSSTFFPFSESLPSFLFLFPDVCVPVSVLRFEIRLLFASESLIPRSWRRSRVLSDLLFRVTRGD